MRLCTMNTKSIHGADFEKKKRSLARMLAAGSVRKENRATKRAPSAALETAYLGLVGQYGMTNACPN
jgi:hypothetical protein